MQNTSTTEHLQFSKRINIQRQNNEYKIFRKWICLIVYCVFLIDVKCFMMMKRTLLGRSERSLCKWDVTVSSLSIYNTNDSWKWKGSHHLSKFATVRTNFLHNFHRFFYSIMLMYCCCMKILELIEINWATWHSYFHQTNK